MTSRNYFLLFIITYLSSISNSFATTWNVGPTRTYTKLSQINNLVGDGDSILIDGGLYLNDPVKWNKKDLAIIGLGNDTNRTILRCSTVIANGKGIFVFETPGLSDNAYIENIVFDSAMVSDEDGANGAGIRFQAANLTVNHCKFMNCQNGILEGNANVSNSNILILNSEFENNGYQLPDNPQYSGYEHHIYISASADTLIVKNCYFHHPRGQANSIKTRAQRSFILYNLIDEGDTGYGSYELNIAQGGLNIVIGNVIIQGANGANHGIVGYDDVINPIEEFYFVNNTVINKYAGNIQFFKISPPTGISVYKVYNNIFASVPSASNTMISGNMPANADTSHNILANDYTTLGFTDPAINDFSLSEAATLCIDHGTNAGTTLNGYSLIPGYMYQSDNDSLLLRTVVNNVIDIGAYEFGQNTNGIASVNADVPLLYPNPAKDFVIMQTKDTSEISSVECYDVSGKRLKEWKSIKSGQPVDITALHPGFYFFDIQQKENRSVCKIIKE